MGSNCFGVSSLRMLLRIKMTNKYQRKYQKQIDKIMKEIQSRRKSLGKDLELIVYFRDLRRSFIRDYQKLSLEEIQRYNFLMNNIDRLYIDEFEYARCKDFEKNIRKSRKTKQKD